MKKKIYAIFLACTICATVFAGCGDKTEDGEDTGSQVSSSAAEEVNEASTEPEVETEPEAETESETDTESAETKEGVDLSIESETNTESSTDSESENTEVKPLEFFFPADYFAEEGQTSTQEDLDAFSVNGKKYEFIADGQIKLTVLNPEAAKEAEIVAMKADLSEFQNAENAFYIPSYTGIDYKEDLSDIIISCDNAHWKAEDACFSVLFLSHAFNYQRYSGVKDEAIKSTVCFVNENQEVLAWDSLENYIG